MAQTSSRIERALAFSATPTFTLFAFASFVRGADPLVALCSASGHGSALTGMTEMYLLMAAFHAAPWLRALEVVRGAVPVGGRGDRKAASR